MKEVTKWEVSGPKKKNQLREALKKELITIYVVGTRNYISIFNETYGGNWDATNYRG
ncbi:MAG: hypothetical protein ACFFC7_33030 [Candidatus Hermodarchaeota archaeon]